MESTLLNYSAGVVDDVVEHRVENGFDVWWRPIYHHIFLARGLHTIMLQDRYDLKHVTEGDVDAFLQIHK